MTWYSVRPLAKKYRRFYLADRVRDHRQISLLILSDFRQINYFPTKNHKKTIGFLMISGDIEVS